MPLLEATWQVTFNSVVLLAWTDYMGSEPEFDPQQLGETVALVRASYATQVQSSSNVSIVFSFHRINEYATPELARSALQALVAAMPTGVHDATIEALDGTTAILDGARIQSYRPRMIEPGHRVELMCELIGGALYIIPVNSVAPVISGTATAGQTLTSTTGTWSNSPTSYGYNWQTSATGTSGWSDLADTDSTHLLSGSGHYVRCQVRAKNAGDVWSAYTNSNVLGPVAP